MPRQSISLTAPNDDWLKSQVDGREYASKSEVVNDLIRKERELQRLRDYLIEAENSGFVSKTRAQMIADIQASVSDEDAV